MPGVLGLVFPPSTLERMLVAQKGKSQEQLSQACLAGLWLSLVGSKDFCAPTLTIPNWQKCFKSMMEL